LDLTLKNHLIFFQYLTNRDKREKINEILQKEAGIAMASEAIVNITREDIEWARKLSEKKYILDTQSMKVDARREGLREGREEGLHEGKQVGRKESCEEIARNALAEGATPEFVQKITGLDLETIKQLAINKS